MPRARYLEAIRWRSGSKVSARPDRAISLRRASRCASVPSLQARHLADGWHRRGENNTYALSIWFWAAFLSSSLTPGISAVQLQRQLGLTRYETAFQILHKLRAGMTRTSADASVPVRMSKADETWVGGVTRGKGAGSMGPGLRRRRRRGEATDQERDAAQRTARWTHRWPSFGWLWSPTAAQKLCGFVEEAVDPATDMVVTDGWQATRRSPRRATSTLPSLSAEIRTWRRTTFRSSTRLLESQVVAQRHPPRRQR